MDALDALASLRELFTLPAGVVYLDGNSLGALPKSVPDRMRDVIENEWGVGLIRSWNAADWYQAPVRVGATIARLVGAQPDEVVVCDSTSVNLFKVLMAAIRMRPGRSTIVSELDNFPTNAYITSEVAKLTDTTVVFAEHSDVVSAIEAAGDDLAAVQLTEVNFRTAQRYDMSHVTAMTHQQGGLAVWDLCHSAGVSPVALNDCHVDFAIGCTYKYLNGGPGSPAFLYVSKRHHDSIDQPLPGWHSHAKPFDFSQDYQPNPGIAQMLTGTAPQLGLLALESALTVFDGVDMRAVQAKSSALTDYFIALADAELAVHGFEVASPRDSFLRGSHVSLVHDQGYAVIQALIARGVIGDYRTPNLLRFGFAPLYLRFVDVYDAVAALRDVMETQAWNSPEFLTRKAVT
jgi:kynureninase